uniref:Uncharacterized protein n=1 Tax=Avena sativa TaxID=4498 RepID=A0ACD6APE7_AVESA
MLTRELGEDGFAGVEIRVTPMRTEIIIRATRTQNVLGEKGRRIRELTSVVQKRFNFPDGGVELYAEKVMNRGLCAVAQAESLRYKLLGGLAVRRLLSNPYTLKLVLLLHSVLPCHLHNRLGSLPARPVFDGDINQSLPSIALFKQWELLLSHCVLPWREYDHIFPYGSCFSYNVRAVVSFTPCHL